MTLELPAWMQENDYSARLDRALISAIFAEGVLVGFVVSQRGAGANMSVDVTAGVAIVDGDDQANQHSYLLESTAVENRSVGAAPGSNSRIDLVVLQVNDTNAGGGSGDNFQIQVIAGTPAASPAPPATPASAIVIARILVTSSTTSIVDAAITDVRSFATLRHDVVDDVNASRLGQFTTVDGASTLVRRSSLGDIAANGSMTQPTHVVNKQYVDGRVADGSNIGTRTINANRLILNSITASEIGPGAVNTSELVDGAVTESRLGTNAVTTAKIASGAVGATQLASNAVTTAKINNGAVTEAKMAALASGTTNNVNYSRDRGVVTVSGELANNTVVVLPAGYRPAGTRYAGGVKTNGPDAGEPGWVSVAANGNVSTTAPGSGPGTGVGFTISFPAA